MECVKVVSIKTEVVDVPRAQALRYREMRYAPIRLAEPGEIMQPPVMDTIEYQLSLLFDLEGQRVNYLVPVDDQGLFSELISVSHDVFKKRLDEKWKDGIEVAKEYVRNLPWWMRLFKRF